MISGKLSRSEKMGKIIALAQQKGGTGKSTTAIHLSYWLSQQQAQRTLLVDADTLQKSAYTWASHLNLPCLYESDPENLFEKLPELAKDYAYVVVDTPGQLAEVTKAVLGCCDVVLIPCQPSSLDIQGLVRVLRFLRHARTMRAGQPEGYLFLSRAAKGTVLARETQTFLSQQDVPLLTTVIRQKQVVADAPGQKATVFSLKGERAAAAAKDYQNLFEEFIC